MAFKRGISIRKVVAKPSTVSRSVQRIVRRRTYHFRGIKSPPSRLRAGCRLPLGRVRRRVALRKRHVCAATLEPANLPTLAHFAKRRAYYVTLRALSRDPHVSLAQYTISGQVDPPLARQPD